MINMKKQTEQTKLKIALPKGRLWESTQELLEKSGIILDNVERRYKPISNHNEIEFYIVKPRNIPKMVEQGLFDAGIVGIDLVKDEGANVNINLDLKTMPVYLVVAGVKEKKKDTLVIASEYVGITKEYFKKKNQKINILKTYGSTECFVPEFADLIVDHVQTGRSLVQNNLNVFDLIMKSTTHLISQKELSHDKKRILQSFSKSLEKGLELVDLNYPQFLTEENIRNNQLEVAKC